MVPCSCTKDKNSIKKILLLVLFAIQLQNTGHIFLILVCIVSLGKKKTKNKKKHVSTKTRSEYPRASSPIA